MLRDQWIPGTGSAPSSSVLSSTWKSAAAALSPARTWGHGRTYHVMLVSHHDLPCYKSPLDLQVVSYTYYDTFVSKGERVTYYDTFVSKVLRGTHHQRVQAQLGRRALAPRRRRREQHLARRARHRIAHHLRARVSPCCTSGQADAALA